jgi:hypothetical protein
VLISHYEDTIHAKLIQTEMKRYLLLLFCSLIYFSAQAQYLEAGVFAGSSNYKGDLSNGKVNHGEHNVALGLFARYNLSPKFAIRGTLLRGEITGGDYGAPKESVRLRNLNFRSEIIEFGITGEFNLMNYNIPNKEISSPYLFAGISVFHFNPQAEYRGQWIDLQPLGTEGQNMDSETYGDPYKRFQVAVPFGLGFKFNLNSRANLGVEFGFRKVFTDYLDDVSTAYPDIASLKDVDPLAAALSYRSPEFAGQPLENPNGDVRGDNKSADSYMFIGLTASVNLTDKYGLDFDKKYDIFKEDYQEYIESQKPINQDKARLKKRKRNKRKREIKKRRKKRVKELNKKKKAGWKRQKQRKENMEGNNKLHKAG